MPNSPTKKDYTQYSEKQLFNLINQSIRAKNQPSF